MPTDYLTGHTVDGNTVREMRVEKSTLNVFPDGIVMGKESGEGIRLDDASPAFGWHDLIGQISLDAEGGPNRPDFNTYRGGLKQYQFTGDNDQVYLTFHIPHDYVPGTHLHIHTHWSQIVVDTGGPATTPGDVKWQFEVSYAKGHDQGAFSAPITTSVVQTASSVQYQHMVAEIQLSNTTPGPNEIDTADIEPDGILLVRVFRSSGDVADTLNQAPFLHFVDIHYQSTGIPTKNKTPNFYT